MKIKIKSIVIILIILFTLLFTTKLFKTNHTISYKISKNASVVEEYQKDKSNDYYILEIKVQKKDFIFDVDNKYQKKKKIVKDVKIYSKDNTMCVYPILIDDSVLDIECNIDGQLYTYTSSIEKVNLTKFAKKIKKFDSGKYLNKTKNASKYNDITIYNDNLYKNENILIYNYKDLIKIKKDTNQRIKFSNFDIYNNNLGILVDNVYLIPNYTKKPEIDSYYAIDILKNKKQKINLKEKLSTSIYINGVIDHKLYIFDKSNIAQYSIDSKTKKVEKTGDKKNMQYYDSKWITYNPYDYVKKEVTFNYIQEKKLPFRYKEIFESDKYYYYYDNENNFYKVYKKHLNHPIYLFNNSMKEITINNNKVYFINKDTIYRYDETGLKNIIKRNEFIYNSKKIYSVYFE